MGMFFLFCILISGSTNVQTQSIKEDFTNVKGQIDQLTELLTTKMEYMEVENKGMKSDIKSLAQENKVIIEMLKGNFANLMDAMKENLTTEVQDAEMEKAKSDENSLCSLYNGTKYKDDEYEYEYDDGSGSGGGSGDSPLPTPLPKMNIQEYEEYSQCSLYKGTEYQYFKVEVPHGKAVSVNTVIETCREASMYPVCKGPPSCLWASTQGHCIVTPLTGGCSYSMLMKKLSEILCQTDRATQCPALNKVFQYHNGYSTQGSIDRVKVMNGAYKTSTSDAPLFAFCAKKI